MWRRKLAHSKTHLWEYVRPRSFDKCSHVATTIKPHPKVPGPLGRWSPQPDTCFAVLLVCVLGCCSLSIVTWHSATLCTHGGVTPWHGGLTHLWVARWAFPGFGSHLPGCLQGCVWTCVSLSLHRRPAVGLQGPTVSVCVTLWPCHLQCKCMCNFTALLSAGELQGLHTLASSSYCRFFSGPSQIYM